MSESFADLLEESLGSFAEGAVVPGTVVGITRDAVTVDIGLKAEGRIDLKEFNDDDFPSIGDRIEVMLERIEGKNGEAVLSREKARRLVLWNRLADMARTGARLIGVIFTSIRGGHIVDLGAAVAFLPNSEVALQKVDDIRPLLLTPQPFKVLRVDRTIVLSRRAVLEERRDATRKDRLASLREGEITTGRITNLTTYGAFVDIGDGITGLLHINNIAAAAGRRVSDPAELLFRDQEIEVQVIRYVPETQRVSLAMRAR